MSNTDASIIREKIKGIFLFQPDVKKVIIFGSFLQSDEPNDIDLAIFTDSKQGYLEQSLKFRKMLRGVSKIIPVDVFPLKNGNTSDPFLEEILKGEVIYESLEK
jgi:uncharacterized protein